MKTIIAAIVFGLIIIAIIVMVIINFTYKGIRKIKEEVEENYYRNQKLKEQKEKNPFGDDYFKSASPSKNKPKAKSEKQERPQPEKQERPQERPQERQQERQRPKPEENTARSQTTSSGVTIIDDRNVEDRRKIFDNSDGEYVEFEEV